MLLIRGRTMGEDEPLALPAARWIWQHGRSRGYRAPSTLERSRGMGLEGYHAALRLPEIEMYNAQSEAADFVAVQMSIAPMVRAWLQGQVVPPHGFPDMRTIGHSYHQIRDEVRQGNIPVQEEAFPSDLLHLMAEEAQLTPRMTAATEGVSPPTPAAGPNSAAEHGRETE